MHRQRRPGGRAIGGVHITARPDRSSGAQDAATGVIGGAARESGACHWRPGAAAARPCGDGGSPRDGEVATPTTEGRGGEEERERGRPGRGRGMGRRRR